MDPADGEVTRLLSRVHDGDDAARDELFRILYERLRDTAGKLMMGQSPGHTLQATALVGEVYLRISADGSLSSWNDRSHFLATAARGMRQVLIDHARRKRTQRKNIGEPVPLDHVVVAFESHTMDLRRLGEVLGTLATVDEKMARAVELRFFGGVTLDEVAKLLGVPERTLQRRWNATRAWIYDQLARDRE